MVMANSSGKVDKFLRENGKWVQKTVTGYGPHLMVVITKVNGTLICNTEKESTFMHQALMKDSSKIFANKVSGRKHSRMVMSSRGNTQTGSQTEKADMNGRMAHIMRAILLKELNKDLVSGIKTQIFFTKGKFSMTKNMELASSTIKTESIWRVSFQKVQLKKENSVTQTSRSSK